MIVLNGISKTFRVAKRNAGMREALRTLFQREYTEVHALRDVSFQIDDGEMVGYIGPNGAGKSSTIKIMSGILYPDSGECMVDGRIPWKDRREHASHIGVVFGQRSQLWWDVPVMDSMALLADIYQLPSATYRASLAELTELLDLSEILRTPTRQLSLGQRMRCEIAASLLHRPKVLFLDEPTIGLDASSKLAVRSFIRKINRERGTTVILTTHDMQDVEALTERILLIGEGRILLDGSLSALRDRASKNRTIRIRYNGGMLPILPGVTVEEPGENHAVLRVNTEIADVSKVIASLSESVSLNDLTVEGISAEELVVALYREFSI